MDFVAPLKGGGVRLIEVKASATVTPDMAGPMRKLAAGWRTRGGGRGSMDQVVVHWPARYGSPSHALAPGVRAVTWQEFVTRDLA